MYRWNGSSLASVRHYLVASGMDAQDADSILPKTGETGSPRIALSDDTLGVFLAATKRIQDPILSLLLQILPATGMRVAEACRVRWADLVKDGTRPVIYTVGKGGKPRIVRLTKPTLRILERLVAVHRALPKRSGSGEWMFPNTRGTGPLSTSAVQNACRALADHDPRLKHVTPHVLRHTWASRALRNGWGLKSIQVNLGHGNAKSKRVPLVTLLYVHV